MSQQALREARALEAATCLDIDIAPTLPSPPGHKPRRRRALPYMIVLGAALVAAAISAVVVLMFVNVPSQSLVVASVPYWNMDYGTASVLSNANSSTFSEISPWMYELNTSGQIVPQYPATQGPAIEAQLAQLRSAHIPIVPTIANVINGEWIYKPVMTDILYNPAVRARHVAAIVALVQQQQYAGIDIDYEDLHASDRNAFSAFIGQLAGALHAHGKILSVDLFAKQTNNGYDERNLAQDYHAIGKVADQVRLMGYDLHWSTSVPGPIAPIGWDRAVIAYAKTQIPAHKIILGVPLYGYDWADGVGTPVSWLQAFRLSKQYNAHVHFDDASQSPTFNYTDSAGHQHVVWFENAPSVTAKFNAAKTAGIGGVYLWVYGLEDTSIWTALRNSLPHRVSATSIGQS